MDAMNKPCPEDADERRGGKRGGGGGGREWVREEKEGGVGYYYHSHTYNKAKNMIQKKRCRGDRQVSAFLQRRGIGHLHARAQEPVCLFD